MDGRNPSSPHRYVSWRLFRWGLRRRASELIVHHVFRANGGCRGGRLRLGIKRDRAVQKLGTFPSGRGSTIGDTSRSKVDGALAAWPTARLAWALRARMTTRRYFPDPTAPHSAVPCRICLRADSAYSRCFGGRRDRLDSTNEPWETDT